MILNLTPDQLRKIVFVTSTAFHDALYGGVSLQEAEWIRAQKLQECIDECIKTSS